MAAAASWVAQVAQQQRVWGCKQQGEEMLKLVGVGAGIGLCIKLCAGCTLLASAAGGTLALILLTCIITIVVAVQQAEPGRGVVESNLHATMQSDWHDTAVFAVTSPTGEWLVTTLLLHICAGCDLRHH